jgi:hypothetical protein
MTLYTTKFKITCLYRTLKQKTHPFSKQKVKIKHQTMLNSNDNNNDNNNNNNNNNNIFL